MEDKIYIDDKPVEFEHNQIRIGCTTISLEDVRRVAKVAEIECVKKEPEAKWKMVNEYGTYLLYGEQTFSQGRGNKFLSSYAVYDNGENGTVYNSGAFDWNEIISLERINDDE